MGAFDVGKRGCSDSVRAFTNARRVLTALGVLKEVRHGGPILDRHHGRREVTRRDYDRPVAPLVTSRLLLRQWRHSDFAPFAELNADPDVMRYFPAVLDRQQSDAFAQRVQKTLARQGWGLWAVEVRNVAPFIGFVGLNRVPFQAQFTPAIEVGWRLDRPHWGRGYATEGARAALDFAFDRLDCGQIVSFTTPVNEPSRRVMQRLGMTRDPADDFDHPLVPDGPLRRHVLYRISREEWREQNDRRPRPPAP